MTEQATLTSVAGTLDSESLDTQATSPENDFDGFNGSDDEVSELVDMSFDTRRDGRATYRETMKAHVETI